MCVREREREWERERERERERADPSLLHPTRSTNCQLGVWVMSGKNLLQRRCWRKVKKGYSQGSGKEKEANPKNMSEWESRAEMCIRYMHHNNLVDRVSLRIGWMRSFLFSRFFQSFVRLRRLQTSRLNTSNSFEFSVQLFFTVLKMQTLAHFKRKLI